MIIKIPRKIILSTRTVTMYVLSFKISLLQRYRLWRLRRKAGVKNNYELLNNGLTMLEWMINEVKAGRKIVSALETGSTITGIKELVADPLEYARQRAN